MTKIKKIFHFLFLNKIFLLPAIFLLSLPILTVAQSFPSAPSPRTPSNFGDFISMILGFISYLIPVLIAIGLLVFLWGMAKFILHAEEEDKREEGRQLMMWGAIGLFVMVSFWGLTKILVGTFGFDFIFPKLKTS